MACIDIYTPKKPRIHESCIEINTCQYVPLHNSWILGFLEVCMSIHAITCHYMSIHAITCHYMPIHNSWILSFLGVYMSIDANTFCIRIHAPLHFLIKILIRIDIVLQGLEKHVLEKIWTRSWVKRCRISQFQILSDLAIFLSRSSSDVAIPPVRILIRRFDLDPDEKLIKSWQNPLS